MSGKRVAGVGFIKSEKQFLACCIGCCVCLLIFLLVTNTQTWANSSSLLQERDDFTEWSRGEEKRKVCQLKPLNPWDREVIRHLRPQKNPFKDCINNLTMFTKLEDGILSLTDKAGNVSECQYRCLFIKKELSYDVENWRTLMDPIPINCDFVETQCFEENMTIFRFIHMQVVKNRRKLFQNEDSLHPSVFLFIFDSTSSSSLIRTLMRTNQILRQYYDATTFYYHNKIGLNTRPNAFGIFAGERITDLDEYEFPGRSGGLWESSCRQGPQRNVTVSYDFMDQNYAIFFAEDWPTAFTYPKCKSYGKNIADHNALPMHSRARESDINEYFYEKSCKDEWHRLVEYADHFFAAYQGVAKYAMIWISWLTHDDVNGLYYADNVIADFFLNNVDNLKNSFIFITGDHGIRHTGIRYTKTGATEDNNPTLTITLPEYLRNNKELILNIRQNARRHTSHYDLYATLYDIARLAKKYNFDSWSDHDFRKEFGERRGSRAKSLLRPINYDRTCYEMDIPSDYCICIEKWDEISTNSSEARSAGETIIEEINNFLGKMNHTDLCATLTLTEVLKAEKLKDGSVLRVQVKAEPSNGTYEARVVTSDDGALRLGCRVRRLDKFGQQGHCTDSKLARPLCYCKKPPESNKTSPGPSKKT